MIYLRDKPKSHSPNPDHFMTDSPAVEKVLASQTFANKEVLKGLLKFLYENSGNGKILKEADIAISYFKRGNEFIPGEDTIVRVTIYKLRALLEKYYSEEGKNDSAIIEIPKGNYSILIKRRGTKSSAKGNTLKRYKLLVALLSASVLFNIILVILSTPNKPETTNPIWSSYIKSSQPVYITFGDPFFYRVKDKSSSTGSLIVRDIGINSKEELELNKPIDLQEATSKISELNYPYFSRNNLWPLPDLLTIFAKANVETRLHTLSETNIEDIKNNNVVFIANINSFGWMNKFLEKTSIKLFTNPRKILISKGKNSLALTVPEFVKGSYVDYAILVKVPGPNNNVITMMGDFHASGLRGLSTIINKGSGLRTLEQELEKKYDHFPEYFEMVVKVTSFNYSDFDTKIIHFKSLEKPTP